MLKYKCKICDAEKEVSDSFAEDWCEKCEESSFELVKVDTTIKTVRYGRNQNLNCQNGCCELKVGHASDVCFGDITMDIVIVYCPICRYEEDVFTK
jgi:hypothetical protein